MSNVTRPASFLPNIARTASGHAVGGCSGCGTGIAYANGGIGCTVLCPGCGAEVRLAIVAGVMSDETCNSACLYARGPDCECGCVGSNHGLGYDARPVPTWVPTDRGPIPLLAPVIPPAVAKRDRDRHAATVARRAAKADAAALAIAADRAAMLAAHPELSEVASNERYDDPFNPFHADMRAGIEAGYLSERQIAACVRMVRQDIERDQARAARDLEYAARDAAAREAGVTVPTGRITFTGTIVSASQRPNEYTGGMVVKITVKADAGWLVWGTCPAALKPASYNGEEYAAWLAALPGQTVTLTASVEPGGQEPFKGFFSRAKVGANKTPAKTRAPRAPRPLRGADPAVTTEPRPGDPFAAFYATLTPAAAYECRRFDHGTFSGCPHHASRYPGLPQETPASVPVSAWAALVDAGDPR